MTPSIPSFSMTTHASVSVASQAPDGRCDALSNHRRARSFVRHSVAAAVACTFAMAVSAPALAAGEVRDPARAFWHAPSVQAFETYVSARVHEPLAQGASLRTAREELEADERYLRMKAWLGRGVIGAVPDAAPTWAAVSAALRSARPDGTFDDSTLVGALGLWAGGSWLPESSQAHPPRALIAIADSIDLPAAKPSLFDHVHDVALGDAPAPVLSGQFGIVHRLLESNAAPLTAHRSAPELVGPMPVSLNSDASPTVAEESHADEGANATMPSYSVALTQPLVRSTLYVDGRIDVARTHARGPSTGSNAAECDDFVPGYRLGDADADFWRKLGLDAYTRSRHATMQPVGSLVSIVTREPVPAAQARVVSSERAMDASTSGFTQARQQHFDLDGDGVDDLVVWEARGDDDHAQPEGQGTAASRHRLIFVNAAGQWHLLGFDTPALDCGGGGC
jgi:hypothetical protein